MRYVWFTLLGYLSGSIMYAYLLPKLFCKIDIMETSEDGNPGAANAFSRAGIFVGMLVLVCELAKGFLPIYFAGRSLDITNIWFAMVMVAPVIGHAFPIFLKGNGGKAIAVSFGVLLGLYPTLSPVITLAFFYLLFSLFFVISPHFYRSICTFFMFSVGCFRILDNKAYVIGCFIISTVVVFKHLTRYHGEKFSMHLFVHKKLERG